MVMLRLKIIITLLLGFSITGGLVSAGSGRCPGGSAQNSGMADSLSPGCSPWGLCADAAQQTAVSCCRGASDNACMTLLCRSKGAAMFRWQPADTPQFHPYPASISAGEGPGKTTHPNVSFPKNFFRKTIPIHKALNIYLC